MSATNRMFQKGAGVSRLMRLLMVVAVCTVLVGGASGASVGTKAKKISTDAYAKTMCNVYAQFIDDVNTFAKDINALEITDNASFQSDVGAAGTAVLAKLKKAEIKLKSIYPDIDDGKKVSKLFAKNTVELQSLLSDALGTFAAADPTSVAFQADIAVFSANLSTLSVQLTDVAPQITDQDLIGSIGDEKACHKYFPVVGG